MACFAAIPSGASSVRRFYGLGFAYRTPFNFHYYCAQVNGGESMAAIGLNGTRINTQCNGIDKMQGMKSHPKTKWKQKVK